MQAAWTAQDSLIIQLSEDAWRGDAEFTVGVDGVLVGGVRTASTLHDSGNTETITIAGNFGTGSHVVTVSFINDAYGGTPEADRNLYVQSVSIDGNMSSLLPTTMLSNGTASFGVSVPAAITPTTLIINLSEDAWMGNARFVVAVDGQTLDAAQDVTALHSSHQSQAFSFTQGLSSGSHDLAVSFLNDAYAGTPDSDRNLYVDSVAVNGSIAPGAVTTMLSAGTTHFSIFVPG